MATRPIPPRPSLEFDKKQAKALLDGVHAGDAVALARLRAHHPRFARGDAAGAALSDAQLVVAREYGFASWPRWKVYVETQMLDAAGRAAELVRAVCGGDARRASALLDAEPAVAAFDLYTACACGEPEQVARVLARDPGAAARPGGPLDRAPILYACFSRFLRRDRARAAGIVRAVRLLLDHGADARAFFETPDEPRRQTCLYGAAGIANDPELTRLLLSAGADVNEGAPEPGEDVDAAGALGPEALYHASEFADVTCLRLLLDASPPPHPRRVSYCLARMLDFENPAGVALYLDHGADPNFRIPWLSNRTHLHRAVAYDRSTPIVRRLVDAGGDANALDDLGLTPLRYAVRHGRDDVAALLRAAGAREAAVTDEDRAVGAAVQGRRVSAQPVPYDPDLMANAAARNDAALLRRLLAAGADADAGVGVDGTPPLHWACWRGQLEAARALVEGGADIHRVNRYGGDALDTAIHGSINCSDPLGGPGTRAPEEITHGDYPAVAELLIAAGAHLRRQVWGSDAVQEVLRRHGVADTE